MKLLSALTVLLAYLLIALPLLAAAPLDPRPLADLLATVENSNPALLAAKEQIALSTARIDQASALPDPQLALNLQNYPINNFNNHTTAMTGNDVKLSQRFPFPGKLATRGELARQQELWARAKYADLLLQVRQQVRDTWFKLDFQRQAIVLTQANIALFDDFIRLTETRYAVGQGLQQNVLQAQVERSRLFERLLGLQTETDISAAQLKRLVGRSSAFSAKHTPGNAAISYTQTFNSLQQQAREHRPLFAAFAALINENEQKAKLAQLDYRPDINIWGSYRFRDDDLPDGGTDFVTAGVSINLPFPVAKRRAAIQEAAAGLRMAKQQRNDFAQQVDFELQRNLAELHQAQKLVDLYGGGIVPQAEQTYKATLAAYQVDKVDFLALTNALMTLYNYQIDFARAQSDVRRSVARLMAITGRDIVKTSPALLKKEDPHA